MRSPETEDLIQHYMEERGERREEREERREKRGARRRGGEVEGKG